MYLLCLYDKIKDISNFVFKIFLNFHKKIYIGKESQVRVKIPMLSAMELIFKFLIFNFYLGFCVLLLKK